MTFPDKLNLIGTCITGGGSTLAMFGAFLQMNGYFAFRRFQLVSELRHVLFTFLTRGWSKGSNRLRIAAGLAKDTESRGTSLAGFYCVLFGFFLQMVGAGFMIWALLHGTESHN